MGTGSVEKACHDRHLGFKVHITIRFPLYPMGPTRGQHPAARKGRRSRSHAGHHQFGRWITRPSSPQRIDPQVLVLPIFVPPAGFGIGFHFKFTVPDGSRPHHPISAADILHRGNTPGLECPAFRDGEDVKGQVASSVLHHAIPFRLAIRMTATTDQPEGCQYARLPGGGWPPASSAAAISRYVAPSARISRMRRQHVHRNRQHAVRSSPGTFHGSPGSRSVDLPCDSPDHEAIPGGYRGTTVQTEQDGRVIDRDEQMTHHCQSPQRPFSSLLRAVALRVTGNLIRTWRPAGPVAPGEHTFAESASLNSRAGPQRANSEQLQCGATARRLPGRWRENANARSFGPLIRLLTDLANKTGTQMRQRACGPPDQGKSFSHSRNIKHSAARIAVSHTDTRRLPQPKRTRAHPTIWQVCSGN